MKFLCNYIKSKASKAGADISEVSLDSNVWKMFKAAVKEMIILGQTQSKGGLT
jgi:hypothetical protein